MVSDEKRTQTTTRQTSKFTKLKYFVTFTCSHGGVKVKMKCTLHIYIVPSVDWYHHWINQSSSFGGTSKFTKSKYFETLTCRHGEVKVKIKCTLHIYIVPSVDWYHHWRNRLSSFGGEATTRKTSKFTKSKYFVTLTCSHGGVKIKWSARCTSTLFPQLISTCLSSSEKSVK